MMPSMAAYERLSSGETLLWVVETRGRVLWRRAGKPGNSGRFTSRELATEEEARRALDEEVAAKLEEGYVLAASDASVDDPLRVRLKPSASAERPHLLPAELAKVVAAQYGAALEKGSLDVREATSIVLTMATRPCVRALRLAHLRCEIRDDGRSLALASVWMDRGSESHDTELEGFEVRVSLAKPSTPGDEALAETVALDYFIDDLHGLSLVSIAREFRRRLGQSRAWNACASARVLTFKVHHDWEWELADD